MSIDVDANNYIIKLQYASLKLFQIIIVINYIKLYETLAVEISTQ